MAHHLRRKILPFTAIVGQEDMKLALILNAINPAIGGVLIRGEKGTAKSTAVRALAELLPEIEVVRGCPFNCNPYDEREMCDACYERKKRGETLEVVRRKMPVVELPLGATEERVVGTLDVERAIKEGIKALEPGILADANRGILYIDEVNLLDDHVADVLLDAAAMGVNVVEREGISVAHPSKFILIGTMNPEEGELRPQLLDRFGLQVEVESIEDVEKRVEIARAVERFESDPEGFAEAFKEKQEALKARILRAKALLKSVSISDELLRYVARTCVELGIKTHRAEIVVARTAKTIAAFNGRTEVIKEDVERAMLLALPHRMRRRPFEPLAEKQKIEEMLQKHEHVQEKHEHYHEHNPHNPHSHDNHEHQRTQTQRTQRD
ncbi:MAG: Mg-chelatase subunit ChlI [Methanophagales archaeon]|nr:ATP-binding protein [Methanophagales archaeon]MCU4139820.1 Mg-chelatase subunit ChlI [Methanophagales archaeon]